MGKILFHGGVSAWTPLAKSRRSVRVFAVARSVAEMTHILVAHLIVQQLVVFSGGGVSAALPHVRARAQCVPAHSYFLIVRRESQSNEELRGGRKTGLR